jgi:hypothetical protein
MSTIVARSGLAKKVPGSPYPLGTGSTSPNPLGAGLASPEPSDTVSAPLDPYRYTRPQARARVPTSGPCHTPTTPSMATPDPDVRREVQPRLDMTSSHDSPSCSHASNSAERTSVVAPNPRTTNLLTTPCAMTGRQRPRVITATDRTATWGRPRHRLQGRQGPLAG